MLFEMEINGDLKFGREKFIDSRSIKTLDFSDRKINMKRMNRACATAEIKL